VPDLRHDGSVSSRWRRAALGLLLVVGLAIGYGSNTIAQAAPPPPYHVVVIGDSFTGGSNEGGVGPFSWTEIVWNSLRAQGIDVMPEVSGQGASGYVQRGIAGTLLGEDAARLITPADRVIVFFGGINDGSQPVDAVSAAAGETFAHARNVAPAAKLIVIGPAWVNPPPPILAVRDALRQQAAHVGAVWVDPIAEGWLTAPGSIGLDGVHPTNAGHQEMADRIEPVIKTALGG
jgi:lysophospholipase L1-like esterase